ncbi:MAG: hypothetical protein WCK38_03540, partial [Candidatus Omnitrophota bacterium]
AEAVAAGLNTPVTDIITEGKAFAAATGEYVLASDIFGIDDMNAAPAGIKNCIVFGDRFKTEDDVKAYLTRAGYSELDINKIVLVNKNGKSYTDLVAEIADRTGTIPNNVGIRAAEDDKIGPNERVTTGRFFDVPTVSDANGDKMIVAFNSYQRMLQGLISLAGVTDIAANDSKMPNGVYYDSVSGRLKLRPIMPANFAEVFMAYTAAMEALSTAA